MCIFGNEEEILEKQPYAETLKANSINIFKGNLERLRQSKEIDLFVGN